MITNLLLALKTPIKPLIEPLLEIVWFDNDFYKLLLDIFVIFKFTYTPCIKI